MMFPDARTEDRSKSYQVYFFLAFPTGQLSQYFPGFLLGGSLELAALSLGGSIVDPYWRDCENFEASVL